MALKNSFKLALLIIVLAVISAFAYIQFSSTGAAVSNEDGYPIYLFTASGCPHCSDEKAFLNSIKDNYNLSIREYEISKNIELYKEYATNYSIPRNKWGQVPVLFLKDGSYIIGYGSDETTGAKIESLIQDCIETCEKEAEAIHEEATEVTIEGKEHVISILGKEIKIGISTPLVLLAVLLALVDGINPCTLIVMLILLGYLIGVGSKKLVLKAGIVFVSVVYAIYALFMYGIFNIMIIIPFLEKIKLAVGIFALFAGAIFIKDFFFLHKWFSLKIPKFTFPTLQKLKKTTSLIGVAILAAFASIVELPCTAGFPVIYTTIMADRGVSTMSSIAYILWYNIFYIIPLLVLVGLVYWAHLKVEDMEEWRKKSARWMRLVGGLVMLALGIAILTGVL